MPAVRGEWSKAKPWSEPRLDLLAVRDQRNRPPVGLCGGCHRPLFSTCGAYRRLCGTCRKFRADHPDRPFEESDGIARVQPQGRPVLGGTDWKVHAECRGADPQQFEVPDVDPPILELFGDEVIAKLRSTAHSYCGVCPVREQCAAEADLHKYEGLFGGVLRILRTVKVGHRGRRRHELKKVDLLDSTTAPHLPRRGAGPKAGRPARPWKPKRSAESRQGDEQAGRAG